jgi:hypothetical protein
MAAPTGIGTSRPSSRLSPTEALVFACSSLAVPPAAAIKRDITRPAEFRPADFVDKFDAETLFYDFVATGKEREHSWLLIAPPLRNLLPLLAQASINGHRVGSLATQYYNRYLCCDVWMVNVSSESVLWHFPFGSYEIAPQESQHHLYEGRRVLYTLSKDNDLRWIADWVRFHVRNHGADAVLVYDNASTRYTGEELENALRSENPSLEVNVVSWPFRYGPQGIADQWWDSNFCQSGALHDARFRFLERASSVLNCDIDELVVSEKGESVFAATERAAGGYLLFAGRWMASTAETRAGTRPRHGEFQYLDLSAGACPTKWCVVPAKCALERQWHTHGVGAKPVPLNREFAYRHFRSISTDWKYERTPSVAYDPRLHELDRALLEAMRRAEL